MGLETYSLLRHPTSGAMLRVQGETHVYTAEESQKAKPLLSSYEVMGYEGSPRGGNRGLLADLADVAMQGWGFVFLASGEVTGKRDLENLSMEDYGLCTLAHREGALLPPGTNIPFLRRACFNSVHNPVLTPQESPLQEFHRLEDGMTLSFKLFAILGTTFMAVGAAIVLLGPFKLYRLLGVVGWKGAVRAIEKAPSLVLARAANPFSWPRLALDFLRPQNFIRSRSWLSGPLFGIEGCGFLWSGQHFTLMYERNHIMARNAHTMVTERGFDQNLIVVGTNHVYGITEILTEDYGYQRIESSIEK